MTVGGMAMDPRGQLRSCDQNMRYFIRCKDMWLLPLRKFSIARWILDLVYCMTQPRSAWSVDDILRNYVHVAPALALLAGDVHRLQLPFTIQY